ncbi:MAG: PilZ domain-containing protein [Bryobacterales bacterium]
MLAALEIQPAMDTNSIPSRPHLRVEPRRAPAEVVTLFVAAWVGNRRFCEARVIERGEDSMTILAAAPLEKGEQVWFNESSVGSGLFVSDSSHEDSGFRIELQRERRRSPRWRVDEHGEMEWRANEKTVRASVVVLDVSAGGLRIRTTDTVPESGEVRIKFAGMVRDGELRYTLPMGEATVAGIEFA